MRLAAAPGETSPFLRADWSIGKAPDWSKRTGRDACLDGERVCSYVYTLIPCSLRHVNGQKTQKNSFAGRLERKTPSPPADWSIEKTSDWLKDTKQESDWSVSETKAT